MAQILHRLTSTDDSDNAITFNGGGRFTGAYLSYVSSADAGNRQIEFRIKDNGGAVVYSMAAGAVQAAGATRTYAFLPRCARESAFVSGHITVPVPEIVMGPSWSIQIIDTAAIAATADDFTLLVALEDR